jgi:hypothetical protein
LQCWGSLPGNASFHPRRTLHPSFISDVSWAGSRDFSALNDGSCSENIFGVGYCTKSVVHPHTWSNKTNTLFYVSHRTPGIFTLVHDVGGFFMGIMYY